MTATTQRDRIQTALGSHPTILEDPTTDALAAMVIALLGEVAVLRDRLDANERLIQAAGGHGPAMVDGFRPDADARTYRATYREGIYDRVLGVARDRLLPDGLQQQRAYDTILTDVTSD